MVKLYEASITLPSVRKNQGCQGVERSIRYLLTVPFMF